MSKTSALRSLMLLSVLLSACHHDSGSSPKNEVVSPAAASTDSEQKTAPPAQDTTRKKAGKAKYETVFYDNDGLKIEAYVYRPEGKGPFPIVIYNHGSRKAHERKEVPVAFVGNMLASKGYVVVVPERRGYGKSEGTTFSESQDAGEDFITRMNQEAGDVLASRKVLGSMPEVDASRIGMVGFSFGGIVTVLAMSRTRDIRAAVNQAGGSLSWKRSPELRAAMTDAAGRIKVPLLSMDAENDATNESVQAVDAAVATNGGAHKLVIYPAFTPQRSPKTDRKSAPGHMIFTADGMPIWKDEVVAWLDQHVKGGPRS